MSIIASNISRTRGIFYSLFKTSNKSALYVCISTICIYNADYIACENSNISCNSANVEFIVIVNGV